jgi:hypothetical protein
LISNPRDNHGFGQLKERQFLRSMPQMESFLNISPAPSPSVSKPNILSVFTKPHQADSANYNKKSAGAIKYSSNELA